MTEEIPHGEKMISFKLRFWTTGLDNPKMAWNKGAITVITNRSRGIRDAPDSHVFFHSIEEIPKAVKEILKKNGITLVEKDKETKRIFIVDL
jgi:hypothetical protein